MRRKIRKWKVEEGMVKLILQAAGHFSSTPFSLLISFHFHLLPFLFHSQPIFFYSPFLPMLSPPNSIHLPNHSSAIIPPILTLPFPFTSLSHTTPTRIISNSATPSPS